jgi:hypothetical protein
MSKNKKNDLVRKLVRRNLKNGTKSFCVCIAGRN